MRHTGSKNKIARRETFDLGMKTIGSNAHASLLKKINILPGQHGNGTKKRRKVSEWAKQLRQKQKLRFLFGLTEKQLKKYFRKAVKMEGNTAALMSNLLERRLDNVVYRLGFAPTRASARQLVSHRHIAVNGKTVNIPSYILSLKEKVELPDKKSQEIPYIQASLSAEGMQMPKWLQKKEIHGTLISEPTSEEIEKQVDLRSVVEYYSR